jgi:uncharacterized protein YjiS (DUF1127 family)
METTAKDKSHPTLPTEARDKSVRIRIVSRKGKTREETRRDLMEMSGEQLKDLFENYDFLDPLGHKLTRSVLFQELLRIAVQGSDCLIEEAATTTSSIEQ